MSYSYNLMVVAAAMHAGISFRPETMKAIFLATLRQWAGDIEAGACAGMVWRSHDVSLLRQIHPVSTNCHSKIADNRRWSSY